MRYLWVRYSFGSLPAASAAAAVASAASVRATLTCTVCPSRYASIRIFRQTRAHLPCAASIYMCMYRIRAIVSPERFHLKSQSSRPLRVPPAPPPWPPLTPQPRAPLPSCVPLCSHPSNALISAKWELLESDGRRRGRHARETEREGAYAVVRALVRLCIAWSRASLSWRPSSATALDSSTLAAVSFCSCSRAFATSTVLVTVHTRNGAQVCTETTPQRVVRSAHVPSFSSGATATASCPLVCTAASCAQIDSQVTRF